MQSNDSPPTPIKFTFDGDDLDVVTISDGSHWLVLARLCEPFNLRVDGQAEKLRALPWARTQKIWVRDPRGQEQEVVCIDIRSVAGWLFTLNAGKVAPHLREKLTRYQRECAEVLADHFLGARGVGLTAGAAGEQIAQLRREKAVLETKVELYMGNGPGVIGKPRATAWILGPLREAAHLACAVAGDDSRAAYNRTFKDAENQLRLHVAFPASTAQRWENLPLDRFGDAVDKVMEILARAERDAKRAKKPPGGGGGQGNLFALS